MARWRLIAMGLGAAAATAAIAVAAQVGRPSEVGPLLPRTAAMVTIPAGVVMIGDNQAAPEERPAFSQKFAAFRLDRTPVTVAQFEAFAAETGHVTDAERFGESAVMDPKAGAWGLVKGATWRRPMGPEGTAAPADHPVTQVSWNDASAFCAAYGLRLPTEFEWERAARMGQTADGHVFKAGDPVAWKGRFRANIWQGVFPIHDSGEDGYRTTSPVGAFGETPAGLTDMAGNVWEWTASWRRPYADRDKPFKPGPGAERIQRGGSFLCDPGFCEGFRVSARSRSTPDSSLINVGFRCAADLSSGRPATPRT